MLTLIFKSELKLNEKLFVLKFIDSWAPGVGEDKKGLVQLILVKIVILLLLLLLEFLLGLLSLFHLVRLVRLPGLVDWGSHEFVHRVQFEILPNQLLQVIRVDIRSKNSPNFHENFQIFLLGALSLSVSLELTTHKFIDGFPDDGVLFKLLPFFHGFDGIHIGISIVVIWAWVVWKLVTRTAEHEFQTV